MSRSRTLAALEALAARPGTPHEGEVARAMLERFRAKRSAEEQYFDKFRDFLRSGSMEDLAQAVGENTCDCGSRYPAFQKCANLDAHERIAREILERFPRGTEIYYNKWAYAQNCPGKIVGYSHSWNWARIKFDHLKNSRSCPIYSAKGWHISKYPLDYETLCRSGLREGMENIDRVGMEEI